MVSRGLPNEFIALVFLTLEDSFILQTRSMDNSLSTKLCLPPSCYPLIIYVGIYSLVGPWCFLDQQWLFKHRTGRTYMTPFVMILDHHNHLPCLLSQFSDWGEYNIKLVRLILFVWYYIEALYNHNLSIILGLF